jgi:hypothetical protein
VNPLPKIPWSRNAIDAFCLVAACGLALVLMSLPD